jgi:hypothetical protein
MNTTTAKKLGEVLALATAGNETIEAHEALFRDTLGIEMTAHIIEMNDIHAKNIVHLADEAGTKATLLSRKEELVDKVRAMRDIYLADSNNKEDLFEWLSFFEGAAYGHWSLVKGLAETLEDEALTELADDASNFHFELLNHIATELGEEGQQAV